MIDSHDQQFRADLHCHSTCSDGTASPKEIIELAHEVGLQGVSITDHDTVDAYGLLGDRPQELGVQVLSGVEFSATHKMQSVHILAYGFSLGAPSIEKLCQRHKERREERNQVMVERLRKNKLEITQEELRDPEFQGQGAKTTIGRVHMARVLVAKGYARDIRDAFQKYLGDGKCAFHRGPTISAEETIDAIHEAQAWAILAHPHLCDSPQLLREVLQMPFDGLEGYYARLFPHQEERWIRRAQKKGWIVTGGSDFHGENKIHNNLGCSWVKQETFEKLSQGRRAD